MSDSPAWELQKPDFVADGSLRDIYVLETSLSDWRVVLELLQSPPYDARLTRADPADATVPLPANPDGLFQSDPGYRLRFTVAGVELVSHFLTPEEIEFDLVPNGISEEQVRQLLCFMAHLGDAVRKRVVMTPENARDLPFYEYDPVLRRMQWHRAQALPEGER